MSQSNFSRVRVPFVEHLGIRLLEQTREQAAIALDRRPALLNSWGAAHGGVIMTMLDYVMSAAVRGHYGMDSGVLTVDMSVGFMKAGFGERIHATARVLHSGTSTAFCEGEARDEKDELIAKAIGTFKLLAERK
jgi:uncharacterized protein (TIGR00369 family)